MTATHTPHRYDAEAFFNSTSFALAGRLAWTVDDQRVLISSDETGIFNVYALDMTTGERTARTHSTIESCYAISAFPSDERLLYTADQGGNEINHLYVLDRSGKVTDLTPGDSVKAMFVRWAKDFAHFYVATNERDPQFFDLYRYNAGDYAVRRVFQNDGAFTIGAFDGDRYLALLRSHSSVDSDLYLVDLRSQNTLPRCITAHTGHIEHRVYHFTPDGSGLIYGTNGHGEFNQAWSYEVPRDEHTLLAKAEWDISLVTFSESGRYRVTYTNVDGRTEATLLDQTTDHAIAFDGLPEGDIGAIRFSRDERRAAVMLSTDTSPPDIYSVSLDGTKSRRLTRALNPAIDESHLVRSEVVRYASYDGLEIPGILLRPVGADAKAPCPVLVMVHGGPGGQSRCGYDPLTQHLVNHGYAVLAANNRGSSGYGKTFFHMDDRRHGEVDLDDIVWAEKYLASLDWIDSARIGIIGGSYGGYMVGAALAFRPEVFKVGIDIFGVMNWVRTLKAMPAWWGANRDALYDEMGDPATDEERLTRISPLFHAQNIRAPLLVVQGANDPRVLQAESDEIVAAVRANGVPVEYVVFDNEGHGFSKRANRISASNTYVTFLAQHL